MAGQEQTGQNESMVQAMNKLQDKANKLENGLKSAIEIILQLGRQLNEVQGVEQFSNQLTENVDELETIDSVVDLLGYMRNDKRNLLVRNPRIQQLVQNSVSLFSASAQRDEPL